MLEDLRGRLRRLFLTDGLVSLALAALAGAGCSFLLDYFLRLPGGVRLVFLVAGVGALLFLLERHVRRRLARPLQDDDLAQLVERAHPELRESLLTAVELTRAGNENSAHVSTALLDAVVRDVEQRTGSLDLRRVLDRKGLHRKMAILAPLFLVLAGAALSDPGSAFIWLRRNLLLSDVSWPRRTELELQEPRENPVVVAAGDNLNVVVRLVRGSAPRVYLQSEFRGGGRDVRLEALAEGGGGVYRKLFANVSQPFRFSLRAGDDLIGPRDVEVRLRPRIELDSVRIWCRYPQYTGWVDTPEEEPIRSPNLKVPAGTAIRYQMATNVPVGAAYFVYQRAEAAKTPAGQGGGTREAASPAGGEDWPVPGAEKLDVDAGRTFAGRFTPEATGRYYFQFESADGFRSRKPDQFRVEVVPDRKPAARVVEPARASEEVSPDAVVALRAAAHDDYGIKSGAIEVVYFPAGSDQGQHYSFPLPGLAGAASTEKPGEEVEAATTLHLATLGAGGAASTGAAGEGPAADGGAAPRPPEAWKPPEPGARFQFFVQVTDFGGNVGESSPVNELRVVSKEDLLRILNDYLMVARDQLQEILRAQRSVRIDVEELQKTAAIQGGVTARDAPRLARHRQDQERVSGSLVREVGELNRLLDKMNANNVGDKKWRDWVAERRNEVAELGTRKSPALEKSFSDLREAASASTQEAGRLASIAGGQRELERDLEALVYRLTELGDMNALIEMLRDLRRRQTDVREATRQKMGPEAPAKEP